MTATAGAKPQEALAVPPTGVEDAERRRQLLQALTTEHFTPPDWPLGDRC